MTQMKRLSLVLGINVVMIAGLLIVGLASHSLGVLAAGGDEHLSWGLERDQCVRKVSEVNLSRDRMHGLTAPLA